MKLVSDRDTERHREDQQRWNVGHPAKSRGSRLEASWLTLLLFFLLPLSLLPPLHIGRYTASGTRMARGIYYCGLQFIPRVLKGPPRQSSCPRPRHGSTSLPKCGSDPLGVLLFSPCAPSFFLFVFSFSLSPLQPLVGAPVGNFAYLAPPGFQCPAPRSARGFLPSQANMPAGRGGASLLARQVREGEGERDALRRSHLKTM